MAILRCEQVLRLEVLDFLEFVRQYCEGSSDEDLNRMLNDRVVHRVEQKDDLLDVSKRRGEDAKLPRGLINVLCRVADQVEVALEQIDFSADLGNLGRVQ